MDEKYIDDHIDTKFVSEKDRAGIENLLGFIPRFTISDDKCSFYVKVEKDLLKFCPKENNNPIVINVPNVARETQVYLEAEPHWTAFSISDLRVSVYHKFNSQFSSA